MTKDRLQKIEEALLEYIERYGLTEKARALYCVAEGHPSPKASRACPPD